MMREVKGPEILGRQDQERAADPGHHVVQAPAAERRAVNRLVQRREQEHQDDAVQQHRRHQPERAAGERDQPAGHSQDTQMSGELRQAVPVGAGRERAHRGPLGTAQSGGIGQYVVHRLSVSRARL
jgi:hypothetical protein